MTAKTVTLAFSPVAIWDNGGKIAHVVASAHLNKDGRLVVSVELPDEHTFELTFPAEAVFELPGKQAA